MKKLQRHGATKFRSEQCGDSDLCFLALECEQGTCRRGGVGGEMSALRAFDSRTNPRSRAEYQSARATSAYA
jgi:hypothetical protein